MRTMYVMLILLFLPILFATSILGSTQDAVLNLCIAMKALIPVVAMLMVFFAGVIYVAGQMMGAETRARANVWATAALTGALMAILIVVVAPSVLGAIYGPEVNCDIFTP
jgi:hypothetical protein